MKREFVKPWFIHTPEFQPMVKPKSSPKTIDNIVETQAKKKKWIVHGARALNKQLPSELQRRTKDWDLFSSTPRKSSIYLEKKIEESIGVDAFDQAAIPLTGSDEIVYRIVSKTTGEEVADFMKTPNHRHLYTVINGVRYETLEHAKQAYERILSNPIYMHRWQKTRRDLMAIEEFESKLKKKKEIKKSEIPSPFVMMSFKPMWS